MIARVLAASLLPIAACTSAPVRVERSATPDVVVVTTELEVGRVELAIRSRYVLGRDAVVDVTLIAARGTVSGPTDARVLASGVGTAQPAEVLVKRLAVRSATASAGGRAATTVTWDGTDEFGARVPADAYVLVLDFSSSDGDRSRTARAAATLQMTD